MLNKNKNQHNFPHTVHYVLKKKSVHTDHNIQYVLLFSTAELMTQHHAHSILSNYVIRYIYPKIPESTHWTLYTAGPVVTQLPHWFEKSNKSQRPKHIINKDAFSNFILTPTGLEACRMFTNCCHYRPNLFIFFPVSYKLHKYIFLDSITSHCMCCWWYMLVRSWQTVAISLGGTEADKGIL